MSRPATWRCRTCGATFAAWKPAEEHADTHRGARLEWLPLATGDNP